MALKRQEELKKTADLASSTPDIIQSDILAGKIDTLKSLPGNSDNAVILTDSQYKILFINKAFLKQFNHSKNEILQKSISSIIGDSDFDKNVNEASDKNNGKSWSGKLKWIYKNGDSVSLISEIHQLLDQNGNIHGFMYSTSAPTKNGEKINFVSLVSKYLKVFKRYPDIIITADANSDIIEFTPYYHKDIKDKIDLNNVLKITDFFPPEIQGSIKGAINSVIANGNVFNIEFPVYPKQKKKLFEARFSPLNKRRVQIIIRDITREKCNELALRGALLQFQSIWDNSLDAKRLMDSDGNIVEVNKSFCNFFNVTKKEIIGRPFYIVYEESEHEYYKSSLVKIKNAFGRKNFKANFEGDIKLRSGETIFVESVSTLIESDQELPLFESRTFMFTIFRNITDRKNKEKELLKLKEAFEASGEIMFLTDSKGIITMINPSFSRLYGYEADEIVGKATPRILKSGLYDEQHYEEFWNNLINREIVRGEIVNKTKDGKFLVIENSVNPILDEKGEILGFLAIQKDITSRKKVENELKYSELRFRSIWEKSMDGMRLTDENGIITAVNPAFCRLVELNEKDIVGKSFVTCYLFDPGEDEQKINKYKLNFINRTFRKERYSKSTLHNSKTLFLTVSYTFVEFANESLILGIFRDITEYKKKEEELHAAERLAVLGKMSAFLSHEIKSPLNTIKNSLEIFFDSVEIPENMKKTMHLMSDEIEHVNKLLKDVLKFSGDRDLVITEIYLKEGIDLIKETLEIQLNSKNINFVNKINDIKIFGDYIQFRSIFQNLIENAIDAIGNNGTIEFSGERIKDEYFSVLIKDTGSGITHPDKIFNSFYTTKLLGTGLGLPIVKKIMEMHNGDIRLLSSVPGETIFELKFPIWKNGKNSNN